MFWNCCLANFPYIIHLNVILNHVMFVLYQKCIVCLFMLITNTLNFLLIWCIVMYGAIPQTSTWCQKQYFLPIVDDCTRFTWIHLMKSKSEAPHLIQCFFKFVKTQFDKKIKENRTDNAKELTLHSFFEEEGTLHQLSCIRIPQQNSVGGWKHQHLLNVARALYFQYYKVPTNMVTWSIGHLLPHLKVSLWTSC